MKLQNRFIIRNITRRPVRTITQVILALFLSGSVFVGSMVVLALQNGLKSLEERLGADIMVVPYEAATKSDLENIVLQGNPGYFYMDKEYLDKISAREGIGRISAQYYLASVNAGCCSVSVEIIGFDPETDFTIQPWIQKSSSREIGYLDVVVGNDLNAFVGDTLSFFGVNVRVVAKLDKTGTGYDKAVFTTEETIKTLIDASLDKQLNSYASINSGNIISCILIDVADGYDVESVLNDINVHLRGIKAVRTTNLIAGVADGLTGVSKVTKVLIAFVWVVSLAIMVVAYIMMTDERKKEFAILRVVGASEKMLSGMVFKEAAVICLSGSILGVLIGCLFVFPFSSYIEGLLGLPFLIPSVRLTLCIAVCSIILSTLAGTLAAGVSARKIARLETGSILRSGE